MRSDEHNRLALATSAAALVAVPAGVTVNAGLPQLGCSVGARPEQASWLFGAFLLSAAATLPLGGAVGDNVRRRNAILAGLAVLAGGPAACAAATGSVGLFAGRVAQGVASGMILPNGWR